MSDVLSMNDPIFSNLAFYSTACVVKMVAMSFWTIGQRMGKGAFANPEDVKAFGKRDEKVNLNHLDIERVRRNHLNDLENIPAFIIIGLFYVATKPSPTTALWHFRAFAISRFLHTICYQCALPQPTRALCFTGGVVVCLSMAWKVLSTAKWA